MVCYFWLDPKIAKRSRPNRPGYSVPCGSLSRLKLASLKQQTLRALTTVTALNARPFQLKPLASDAAVKLCKGDTFKSNNAL